MKIYLGRTEAYVETPCTGCQCHEMAMQFGEITEGCCECGCPKTYAAWLVAKAKAKEKGAP